MKPKTKRLWVNLAMLSTVVTTTLALAYSVTNEDNLAGAVTVALASQILFTAIAFHAMTER